MEALLIFILVLSIGIMCLNAYLSCQKHIDCEACEERLRNLVREENKKDLK